MNQDSEPHAGIVQALTKPGTPSNELTLIPDHDVMIEELERELPVVHDGQVPLGELLSRVVQAIYAELSELAETMPNMSDSARKRTLADWVVKTKKQVVKLFAVVKWARDANTVQKCMNITAFLMEQNQQFEDALVGLKYAKESLDPARLRNHDLLTSLDVLTTGSYTRLPTYIKQSVIPRPLLTDTEVKKTLTDMEDVIQHRLRLVELIPIEMSNYRINDGRAHFRAPNLFETSLCLQGTGTSDGWFFVHVEFLITVGGDATGLQEFPRIPAGIIKRHITDEANARLAFYLPLPADQFPAVDSPAKPQLPDGVVDAPLVRLYNFLQMMSLTYQLEILWYQAERMRSLGWADYLNIQMSPDRKSLIASYWMRAPPPQLQGRPRLKLPLLGGTLTISIIEGIGPNRIGPDLIPTSRARVAGRLQLKAKLKNARPSDEVERFHFAVHWEPSKGALGVAIPSEDSVLPAGILRVDANNLDFESMLRIVVEKHAAAILSTFQHQLQQGAIRTVFSPRGVVSLVKEGGFQALHVHLCADETVIITIDSRTGRLTLRDTGDLATGGRGIRFSAISEKLNENPTILLEALARLRISTILDFAEQKANYLGLRSYRRRNFKAEEMSKFGPSARGTLYVQLSKFPDHYLVLVITDDQFRYAFITTKVLSETMYANLVMEDIAWLDFDRIHGEEFVEKDPGMSMMRKQDLDGELIGPDETSKGFNLDSQVLRELYNYCCARVAYMRIERQFKLRKIPFVHVNPTTGTQITNELAHVQSSLARSVPALCVQSSDILSGAPAAEAAMPNIRVIPLNWWSNEKAQVVTCVKLKYVQQPLGRSANSSTVIRPSKRIIYDTTEAVVSFLSEDVDTCVDEFLEEWAKVSKMVVIAREVAQMAKEKISKDIRLVSFDLQTVEFVYALDYTVSISCEEQLSPSGGNFNLRFARCSPHIFSQPNHDNFNPHEDAEPYLRNVLRHGHDLAPSIHRLITLLRDTLPIVVELEAIRRDGERLGKRLETFAKSVGWYRLSYDDFKHALDFRLMNGNQVAILDGSHSLFSQNQSDDRADFKLGLQPIPGFRDIVSSSVTEFMASENLSRSTVAAIDVGVICDTASVGSLGRTIHNKILTILAS